MPPARARKLTLPGLAVAVALSCSIFPDHAELPPSNDGGVGGEPSAGGANAVAAGHAPEGGNVAEAGAASTAGVAGAGGEPPASAGAAGAAACATEETRLAVEVDTWIESEKPSLSHGDDPSLFVVNEGPEERRALLSFDLPPLPDGYVLQRAELRLQLESNADAALSARVLEVRQLEQPVNESRTTWNNWGNGGNRQWNSPGGDFGPPLASADVPALTQDGPVTFDLTSAVAELLSTALVPLPLIVREVGSPPTLPAELAFTSRQGDALNASELLLEYCR